MIQPVDSLFITILHALYFQKKAMILVGGSISLEHL